MNHLNTLSMRSFSLAPSEIAANRSGCSHQYAGNSVNEIGDRMTTDRQTATEKQEGDATPSTTHMVGRSCWIDRQSCASTT